MYALAIIYASNVPSSTREVREKKSAYKAIFVVFLLRTFDKHSS